VAVAKAFAALRLEYPAQILFNYHSARKRHHQNGRESRELEDKIRGAYNAVTGRCLKSLSFSEMKVREANIDRPTKDTCVWIYQNPVYRSWEAQQHTLLWIKGHPGSGKSVLMKSLYSKRKQMPTSTMSPMILSFFFNARGAAIEKTPLGLYITMLHDLLKWIPVALCEFLPHFLEKEMTSAGDKVSWNLVEVADAFHQIIACKQPRPIEVLIDALDECKEDEVRSVIRNFESTIADARLSGADLKVCWSSRYYPHISLVSEDGLELLLDEQNNGDITRYVRKEFRTGSDAVLLSMQYDLIRKANGVFLWAVLVIRQLHAAIDKGKTELELKHLLNSIPTKLEDLFNDIFQDAKASPSQREELLIISRWVFCSERPLTAAELFTALQLQRHQQPCSIVACDPTKRDIDSLLKRVVDLSGGLFEGAFNHRDDRDMSREHDQTVFNAKVQVIHESVREFFLGSKGRKLLQVSSADEFLLDAHEYMAKICFQALLSIEFEGSTVGKRKLDSISEISSLLSVYLEDLENDFLTYAHNYGFGHFEKARDRYVNCTSAQTSFWSVELRRQALVNFSRLSCAQPERNVSVSIFSNTQMHIVAKDPAAFGLERTEYLALLSFLNDFRFFVASFPRLPVRRFQNSDMKVDNHDCTEFIALYFVITCPTSWQKNLWPSIRRLDDTNLEKLILTLASERLDWRFVFAATVWIDGEDATARLRYQMAKPFDRQKKLHIVKWAIEEDIHNLADLIDGHRVLLDCKQARLTDNPSELDMLCVVLEGGKQENRGKLGQNLPATNHRYGESIVGRMHLRIIEDGFGILGMMINDDAD
jgi:hypothetical protein